MYLTKNKLLLGSVIISSLLISSCEEADQQPVQENLNESFSKTIELSDSHGNSISFDISSNNKKVIESYSSLNYKFEGLSKMDLETEDSSEETFETGEEDLNLETQITLVTSNVKVNLQPGFTGYSLTEDWDAPDGLEDRGFDWRWQNPSAFDYAKVKNNRCCWAIYSSWYWSNYPDGAYVSNVYYNGAPVEGVKIRGGNSSSWYGQPGSPYLVLRIKYRRGSHRTVYYSN
ncbi:hypothetical protein [Reichenbachiella agariperforans]|uniref:hypothetical protein n=1 Tax=Reichenbachiella agariperforans TaxID=156994 RepID=UPI001C081834|nr:hypothetical protein [Reichenbachiella agariperforans]MBU2914144.1 hypothetical protein [Reichenbachiella agariperforans]